ncbi:cell division inhibitor SulA [Izhakiella capsodis]|uniref:Cell division inhibitor SulA n=1 Tax=Izhakiella capsodis TaxID=1367852 RepID=A0A1I4UPL0_9GAMM|nr:SOS-induced cell division inhibitor SulA [Izhakiella capsodis]SFM90845.1 cell division inhibitor SulA [Izhakiella capsodis]
MRTQTSNSYRVGKTVHLDHCSSLTLNSGTIAELVFSKNQSAVMHLMLLPLLQQLSIESRWQLWLTSKHKLSRHWLKSTGLPLDKMMQIQSPGEKPTLEAMNRALRTGNFSAVIGWVQTPPTNEQRKMLERAAEAGHGLGLILCTSVFGEPTARPTNSLKIPSSLYH